MASWLSSIGGDDGVAICTIARGEILFGLERLAQGRRRTELEANASMVLVRDEETADGHSLTRFYDLKLERSRSPMFALTWQIMHRIDESSPLYGITPQAMREGDMRLIVALSGMDEVFAASITARHTYVHEKILFDRRFVDIFSEGDHPRHLYVDLGRFHDLQPHDQPD